MQLSNKFLCILQPIVLNSNKKCPKKNLKAFPFKLLNFIRSNIVYFKTSTEYAGSFAVPSLYDGAFFVV